jgi:hypothetical protein
VAPDDFDFNDAWDWYYRGSIAPCARNEPLPDAESVIHVLGRCAQASERVWLVLRYTMSDLPISEPVAWTLDGADPLRVQVLDAQVFEGLRLYLVEAVR